MSTTPTADMVKRMIVEDGLSMEEALRRLPVVKMPCANCRHLRRPKSSPFAESYRVCGWWDSQDRWPLLSPWIGRGTPSDASRSVPLKAVEGPFSDDPSPICPQFALVTTPPQKEA